MDSQFDFPYTLKYYITHPHEWFKDLRRNIKWSWQRVYRGWDDRASWSVDYWLNSKMPYILARLKNDKYGVPVEFIGNSTEPTDEDIANGKIEWNNALDIMIAGFFANDTLVNLEYNFEDKAETQLLIDRFERGMALFTKYYNNLWD